jgi:hypothetical protein
MGCGCGLVAEAWWCGLISREWVGVSVGGWSELDCELREFLRCSGKCSMKRMMK